ncbi:MAG: flagellar export chaperone FliS [Opitutaceae bacterium]|jgi:flagellar protein FliS
MSGPRDYARIYRENSILTASPGQLILMLFDGAARSMAIAHAAFERPKNDFRRFQVINCELLKAQAIFTELRNALNQDVGGEFAKTMDGLYQYYNRRLVEANIKRRIEPLIEVEQLFGVIRDAWAEMLRNQDWRESERPRVSA